MNKTTQELLEVLKQTSSITDYLKEEPDNLATLPLHQLLNDKLTEKNLSRAELIRRSGMDRVYGYQIFSGAKTPSRDKLLTLCLAFPLTLEETQELLKRTGYPQLYPRMEKDSILIFSLQRCLSLIDTNELLDEMGYEPLA